MKLKRKSMAVRALLLLGCVALFSFSSKWGGDVFEIWLNGKMVLQQFVHVSKGVQTLELNQASENDRLDVYYKHCGQVGKNRYITIQDEKGHALKVWKFADATGNHSAMSFKLKDILSLKKNRNSKLSLFYSSDELPAGRLLATIVSQSENGIAGR